MKEGVAITRHTVTQPRPLLEQPPLPDQVPRLLGGGDVLVRVSTPHRVCCQQEVDNTWGTVTPVDQPVLVIPWKIMIITQVIIFQKKPSQGVVSGSSYSPKISGRSSLKGSFPHSGRSSPKISGISSPKGHFPCSGSSSSLKISGSSSLKEYF